MSKTYSYKGLNAQQHIDVERARMFAVAAHSSINQTRRYPENGNVPYWKHLEEVVLLLDECLPKSTLNKAQILQGAWLHDVIEDTSVTIEMIDSEFGKQVAYLVSNLTDEFTSAKYPGQDRSRRKAKEMQRLMACTPDVQSIKMADIHSNCNFTWMVKDTDKLTNFMAEKRKLYKQLSYADKKVTKAVKKVFSQYDQFISMKKKVNK